MHLNGSYDLHSQIPANLVSECLAVYRQCFIVRLPHFILYDTVEVEDQFLRF